jgi:ankyrin repeat protein
VEAANAAGITSLISSAFFGHERVVTHLLQRGADARAAARQNRRTALHWAAMNDHDTVHNSSHAACMLL